MLLSYFYYLGTDEFASASDFGSEFLGPAVVITAVIGAIVAGIEKAVPALRIPEGAAYRIVGNSRWVLAVAVGAVLGAIWMALRGSSADPAEFTLFVIGYVIAETVIGRVAPSARTVRS